MFCKNFKYELFNCLFFASLSKNAYLIWFLYYFLYKYEWARQESTPEFSGTDLSF